jgi:hypothetical protein
VILVATAVGVDKVGVSMRFNIIVNLLLIFLNCKGFFNVKRKFFVSSYILIQGEKK